MHYVTLRKKAFSTPGIRYHCTNYWVRPSAQGLAERMGTGRFGVMVYVDDQ